LGLVERLLWSSKPCRLRSLRLRRRLRTTPGPVGLCPTRSCRGRPCTGMIWGRWDRCWLITHYSLCLPSGSFPPIPPAPFPPRRGRKGERTATFDFFASARLLLAKHRLVCLRHLCAAPSPRRLSGCGCGGFCGDSGLGSAATNLRRLWRAGTTGGSPLARGRAPRESSRSPQYPNPESRRGDGAVPRYCWPTHRC